MKTVHKINEKNSSQDFVKKNSSQNSLETVHKIHKKSIHKICGKQLTISLNKSSTLIRI